MADIPDDLVAFLAEKRDSREYRRALAVKLALLGYTYDAISTMLDVSPGFISQAKKAYQTEGTAGLTLKYQGSLPFLSVQDRQAVSDWLSSYQNVQGSVRSFTAFYGSLFALSTSLG